MNNFFAGVGICALFVWGAWLIFAELEHQQRIDNSFKKAIIGSRITAYDYKETELLLKTNKKNYLFSVNYNMHNRFVDFKKNGTPFSVVSKVKTKNDNYYLFLENGSTIKIERCLNEIF